MDQAEGDAGDQRRGTGEKTAKSRADGTRDEAGNRAALTFPLPGAQQRTDTEDDENDKRIAGGILAERVARDQRVYAGDGDEDAEADNKSVDERFRCGLLLGE